MDTDAENNPVRRPGREYHSSDTPLPQRASVESREELDAQVLTVPHGMASMTKEYADALAMNEEPVTIRIERSGEKFAPQVIDCWVNGVGAEILVNGKWVMFGALPVGRIITTKRKYVEVLAGSRTDSVSTNVIEQPGEDPRNLVDRTTASRAPFSVVEDKNPKGAEWLRQVMARG